PYNFWQQISHLGFQPAETEILRAEHAARQIKTVWITVAGELFNLRTPRVTEPKHLGDFIERLTCSVIDRAAHHAVITKRMHSNQHRVSAAHNKRNVRPDFLAAICVAEK